MKNFTEGPIGKQLISFATPIILGNFFMQLYQIVDSAIVGQVLGKEALAAVGASMPVVFSVIALVIGIGSGASVVISQYFGANQYDKVRLTSDTLHIVLLVAGVIIAIIGIFCSELIFEAIELPAELIPQATTYLTVYLSGVFLLFGFNSIAAILRGVGDSKTPLYFLIISSILNVALDYLFIVTFKWGIAGAAWATIISEGAAYLGAIAYINKKIPILHIDLLHLKFNKKIFRQCINYGLPTGIQQTFVAFGGIALMTITNGFGTNVIAGFSAGMRIDNLAMIPAMNFSTALTSFVGQNIGAGRIDRVQRGLWISLLYSSLICIVITLGIVIFGHNILRLFTSDEAVISVGVEYLVIVSSFYLIFNAMFMITGLLRGAGSVVAPMLITIIALWGIRIPVAIALSSTVGEVGIWWSIPIGWGVGAACSMIYYFSGKWKNKSIFVK